MEEFLLSFKINDDIWKVYLVDIIDGTDNIFGQTRYQPQDILLMRSLPSSQLRKTLIHELMHIWLWEAAHYQNEPRFNSEEVCDIVAQSHNFITDVIAKYDAVSSKSSNSSNSNGNSNDNSNDNSKKGE